MKALGRIHAWYPNIDMDIEQLANAKWSKMHHQRIIFIPGRGQVNQCTGFILITLVHFMGKPTSLWSTLTANGMQFKLKNKSMQQLK